MSSSTYDFRQFQQELAQLESKVPSQPTVELPEATLQANNRLEKSRITAKPLGKKAATAQRLAMAREEFLIVRNRHDLSVADVVAFFPEEEGIAYLQQLIIAAQAKPKRGRKL